MNPKIVLFMYNLYVSIFVEWTHTDVLQRNTFMILLRLIDTLRHMYADKHVTDHVVFRFA